MQNEKRWYIQREISQKSLEYFLSISVVLLFSRGRYLSYGRHKERKAKEAISGGRRERGRNCYLLLLLGLLVPIGWIKIGRNRRKAHGIELISFDLLLLGSFFSAGLFVPPSLLCGDKGIYVCFRGRDHSRMGKIDKGDRGE
jgi:hypothetical protein